MNSQISFLIILTVLLNLHTTTVKSQEGSTNLQTYIVHLDISLSRSFSNNLKGWYQTFLPTLSSIPSSIAEKPRILYSYHNVFIGFAARLSPVQVKLMEIMPGFISAHPQKELSLHTTHSPNFLGLNQNTGFWRDANYGRGVIIGVLDTGINPTHPSFSDQGMDPPPARWRGRCEFNDTSLCNNKLIGARFFSVGDGTPYDETGHGTHTASTAAGNFVSGANVFGNANGTAAGIAPLAYVATYKVCTTGCPESDILAAMDAAIDDGVDVISLSLGMQQTNFYNSNVAIGSFSAITRGVFVSASAGNRGPDPGTIENGAPWILTVGASSIDRILRATAVLGNSEELDGQSTNQLSNELPPTLLPLVFPGMFSNNASARSCTPESLQDFDVQGRIVLCEGYDILRRDKGIAVRNAGGAAMIIINTQFEGYSINSDNHVLPATLISYADGLRVINYINSTSEPLATISFGGTVIGDDHAPSVTSFSSRGPNTASPGILKPDIIGPGQNILAAWHESVENNTNTRANFNIISGTSMSCPHLSGVAALLRNAHPDWSPASIKSSMMTTADQVNLGGSLIEDETHTPASVIATGSGHVNILRAADPGLVYDIHPEDYVPYLCGLNYTDRQVGIIASRDVRCSEISIIEEAELNYPSFSVFIGNAARTYNRTVTNVGVANSRYTVGISGLSGVDVMVEPSTLQFSALNQSLTYQVTFSNSARATDGTSEGSLTWTSGRYSVRSPILVTFT